MSLNVVLNFSSYSYLHTYPCNFTTTTQGMSINAKTGFREGDLSLRGTLSGTVTVT